MALSYGRSFCVQLLRRGPDGQRQQRELAALDGKVVEAPRQWRHRCGGEPARLLRQPARLHGGRYRRARRDVQAPGRAPTREGALGKDAPPHHLQLPPRRPQRSGRCGVGPQITAPRRDEKLSFSSHTERRLFFCIIPPPFHLHL